MAETLGSLIDKFSIACLRAESAANRASECPTDEEKTQWERLRESVVTQKDNLKNEIDGFISAALKGEVALEEPKFKMYKNEKPSENKSVSLGGAIDKLFEANATLWSLEDQRRDKTKTDAEIREICDRVASFNRLRNDKMDEINKLLSRLINPENP